ncbi:AAA family ATPase [Mycobacterium sp. 141]|uniref:AAA family ATPase n=1 Tax=Mycobacterium sp. 141 TaxID=1120797 RepID=UPI000370F686|nr:AAA family ATPase [Mycobacterium sp. 141]
MESTAKGGNAAEVDRARALTAVLGDVPKPDDHGGVREYLGALAGLGCAPLLVYPASKKPADVRTPQRRSADDRAACEAAQAAGNPHWHKVKSDAGVHLATTDTGTLGEYLDRYAETFGDAVEINVAVSLGRSRLVVVDCDTSAQLAAFLVDAEADPDTAPTVRSPGQLGPDGVTLVHRDGGHFWFTVPDDVELPEQTGSMRVGGDAGYSVMWGAGNYVLTPPSVRAEGPYTTCGAVFELPGWLGEAITAHGRAYADHVKCRQGRADTDSDQVARWGAAVSWASILEPAGWTPVGKADGCGCPTWTAPGLHGSPKSATAHGPGCAKWTDSVDPPLHIWTDNPGEPWATRIAATGKPTFSKLQAVALLHFDDQVGDAMTALGIELTDSDALALPADLPAPSSGNQGVTAGRALRITWACEIEPEPVDWLWVDIAVQNTPALTPEGTTAPDPHVIGDIACVAPGHTWSPPEVETDGRIACGMVSIAAGREGSGKSSFGIWLAAKITRGTLPGKHYGVPKRVYYLATEDSWKHTLVPRLIASGADLTMVARIEVAVNECATVTLSLPEDVDLLTQSITDHGVALVIIDPLMSTMSAGLDTNGTRDVRTALEPLAAMADTTGAAVVALAHFNKATGLDSLTRITGSGAFKDVARAVMVFAVGADGERVFSQPKNSVGRNDLPSLNYEVTGAVVETSKGKAATACFTFTGVADSTVDDSLGNEHRPGRAGSGASPVEQFIADYIASHADPEANEGGVPAADVIAAGAEAGYSESQIKNARSRVTDPVITTQRVGFGKGSHTVWKAAS